MSGNGGSLVDLLSYETLVHAVAGAMVSRDEAQKKTKKTKDEMSRLYVKFLMALSC